MRLLAMVLVVMLSGCNPMVNYAKQRYPRCDVKKIDSETVLVRCPGKAPFEKKFKKGR